MQLSKAAALREFMMAGIRAHDSKHVHLLPAYPLRGAWNIAAFPGIAFDEWCLAMGLEVLSETPAPPGPQDNDEEAQIEHNEALVEQLKLAKAQGADSVAHITITENK